MRLSGRMDRLPAIVVNVLCASRELRDVWQAYALAVQLAQAGNEAVRAAIYARFERPGQDPSEGLYTVIALDREAGLLRVAKSLGRRIAAGEDVPVGDYLLSVAKLCLGKDVAKQVLTAGAQTDPEIRVCLDAAHAAAARRQQQKRSSSRQQALTRASYAELKQNLEAAGGRIGMGHLHLWAKTASPSDFTAAADDTLKETRPAFLLSYLRLFFDRPFPRDPAPLIQWADTGEPLLAHSAFRALAAIRSAAVRDLGLELLRRRHRLEDAFGLFRLNYRPGDETVFIDALAQLERISEIEVLHGAGLDLLGVFEHRTGVECRGPLLWLYEHTPCSHCRGSAVARLLENEVAPTEILCECLDDCDPDTRALARSALSE